MSNLDLMNEKNWPLSIITVFWFPFKIKTEETEEALSYTALALIIIIFQRESFFTFSSMRY